MVGAWGADRRGALPPQAGDSSLDNKYWILNHRAPALNGCGLGAGWVRAAAQLSACQLLRTAPTCHLRHAVPTACAANR